MIKDLIIFNLNLSSFPMQNFNLLWRAFLAIGLIGIVTQQLFYQDFRPVIIPHWHGRLYNVQTIAVYALTILIVVLSIGMLIKRTGRIAVVILGFLLLILFMAFHLPYQFKTNLHFLGGWTDSLKLLSLSGGAFVAAAAIPSDYSVPNVTAPWLASGKYFFALTMLVFGIEHFVYVSFVQTLVPT